MQSFFLFTPFNYWMSSHYVPVYREGEIVVFHGKP